MASWLTSITTNDNICHCDCKDESQDTATEFANTQDCREMATFRDNIRMISPSKQI